MTKYNQVKKVEFDGIIFDSKLEVTRYAELKLLEKAGEIGVLRYHPEPIIMEIQGKAVFKYHPDFTYYFKNNLFIVEDVKGFQTAIFRLKWKCLKAMFPHTIFRIWPDKKKAL